MLKDRIGAPTLEIKVFC